MISIIIPCYNSRKYIVKTLDSLRNQTCKNFKAIFIDDGSSDGTTEVIKEKLEDSDVNYEVFLIQHQGVGAARNYGIKASSTPYIMFLDSDDYLTDNCIELFVHEIKRNSPEVIIGEYEHELKNNIIWRYTDNYEAFEGNLKSYEVLNKILDNKIHIWTSNAIYKSSLFKDISFDLKCMFHEDLNVWYRLINKSEQIYFMKKIVSVYVIRDNSISHDLNIEKLEQGIYMLEDLYEKFQEENLSQNILNKIKNKTMPNLLFLFFNYLCFDNIDIISIYKEKHYLKVMKKAKLENMSIHAFIKYLRIKLIGHFPSLYICVWKLYKNKIKVLLRR